MMEMKKEWKYFTIFNHEKEEEYLRDRHRVGWKFVKVTSIGFYHFEKCHPEDVVYQLDYNKDGLKNKQDYIQMFEDCGWEYIQDYVTYSYFRKPVSVMNGNEEIFCDETSRLAMMERVYQGRLLPLLIIFCASNLGISQQTLSRWKKELRDTGDIESRGSGNYSSDEAKEIARLKRELRDAQDALDVLKKAINILGK